jgi:hypothetical protein
VTNPWADPATETQPGSPYLGPPPTTPQPYGYPGYGHPGYPAYPGYGYPGPWGPVPPRRPQRPGQVVTSAVLAFVQAALVLIASLYLWFFASVIGLAAEGNPAVFASSRMQALTTEVNVLAVVQLLSAVLLVVAGIRALGARTHAAWVLTVGAHALEIVLAAYWAVRLLLVMRDLPGAGVDGSLATATIVFAAGPAVGLGMVLVGRGRRWFQAARHS